MIYSDVHSVNSELSEIKNIKENMSDISDLEINGICNAFKKSELENILSESKKISEILSSLEAKKETLFSNISTYNPKAIHLAHQHLAVIQTNLREQLFEMRTLIQHLEKNHILELEENQSYVKIRSDQDHFHRVFRLFLPYILICSIYLKIHEEERKRREREAEEKEEKEKKQIDSI